jgi:hypothetical protein
MLVPYLYLSSLRADGSRVLASGSHTPGALVLTVLWPVPPFWSVPPEQVTAPCVYEQLEPLRPPAE